MSFRLAPRYRYFGLSGVLALEQGTTDTATNLEATQGKLTIVPYFWNPGTLAFEVGRQPSTGGGGSTAVTVTNPTTLVTVSNPTSAVDATLSSGGSTREVGRVGLTSAPTTGIAGYFQLTNPTSKVDLGQITSTPGSSNDYLWVRTVGSAAGSTLTDLGQQKSTPGSSNDYFWVRTVGASGAGSTEVDANLTSAGSTKLVGKVDVNNPTTSVTMTNPTTVVDLSSNGSTRTVGVVGITGTVSVTGTTSVSVANPTTSVSVTSGLVLGPSTAATGLISSGTQTIGTVNLGTGGSSANMLGAVAQGAGSTSVAPWYVISTASGGAGSTTVDAQASSAGSTRLFGQVTVANPTTAVTVSSGLVLGPSTASIGLVSSGTQTIGTVNLGTGGSTANSIGSVALLAGSSANMIGGVALAAGSSATMLGTFVISSGTSDITIGGVVIESGSSANMVGAVVVAAGSSANMVGQVVLGAASTAVVHGAVAVTSGVVLGPSTAMTGMISSGTQQIGSVALVTGTTGTMGAVAQGPGSSANSWVTDSFAFTSGQTSRSSISTTVDTQVVAANANRKGLVIANRSTAQTVGIGYSTAAVTTALANVDLFIGPSAHISFGFQGTLPNYLGPLRGINLTSTAVGGSVAVTQFLNT